MSASTHALFASSLFGNTVTDKAGRVLGQLWDLAMAHGERQPHISRLLIKQGKDITSLPWEAVVVFNPSVISVDLLVADLEVFDPDQEGFILVRRDILDKQIVDVEGARLVRVNDLKIENCREALCVTAVDTGLRGLSRRLGQERFWSFLSGLFRREIPHQEISWQFVQPLDDKATALALTVTRDMLKEMHPADLAEIISQLPHEDAEKMLLSLTSEVAGETLAEMEPEVGSRFISRMEKEQASDILDEMDPDEVADVLGDLPDDEANELLQLMDAGDAAKIQKLMEHEEDSAGGVMVNEFLAFGPDVSAEDALRGVRARAQEVELIYYIYVVDADHRPLGVASLRDILGADPSETLGELMSEQLKTVEVTDPADDVLDVVEKYGFLAVPVLDKDGVMVGVITADDVLTQSLRFALRRKRHRAVRSF